MLEILTRSTDVDLTTTGRLKAALFGATATSTGEDGKLSASIRAASRWAAGYVGAPLSLATYQETRPGMGTRRLMLSNTPVRSVSRVLSGTDSGTASLLSTEFRLEDRLAGFLSRDDGWSWTVPSLADLTPHPLPGQEARPWLVEYQAGYVYGGLSTASANWSTAHGTTDTGRTLPEDIEEAVIARASALYDGDMGVVTREELGDLKVTYGGAGTPGVASEKMAPAEMLLEPYRRIV